MTHQPFYSRHSFRVLLAMVFLLPFAGLGARRALLTNKNDVKQWLPESYAETRVYQWFQRHFGGEEFVLLSWEGCTLDDDRLELLTRKLTAAIEQPATDDEPQLFAEVLTGPRIIERMTGPPLNLSPEEVSQRLRGSLIGPDGRQTCLVLTLTEEGRTKARLSVDTIRHLAIEECGVPAADLHMGGPPVDNVAIDKAGETSLMRLAGLSAIIGLSMSWWSLRSGRLVALVMIAGVYSLLASMSIVWFSQTPMNAILLSMPALVYVAATSGAIHLANYYRDTVRDDGAVGAPERAIHHAWLPLSLATGTTAVGLLSLAYSELSPIRLFGIFSAIGVVVSLVVLCFFLPAAFAMWPLWHESGRTRRQRAMAASGGSNVAASNAWNATAATPPVDRMQQLWTRAGQWIVGHHAVVTAGCLALLAVAACGLPRIETSVQMMRFFKKGAPLLTDYAWLEEHLGELVPVEIVVRVNEEKSGLSFLECLELVSRVQSEVNRLPDVGSSLSAVTFAPKLDSKSTARSGGILGRLIKPEQRERDVRNRRLSEHRDEFLASDYVREADGELLWRISARVGALKNVDFAAFSNDLRRQIDPVIESQRARLAEAHGRPIEGVGIVYTGLMPIVYKAQNSLLDGLVFGFFSDLVLIILVMIVAIRSLSAGLLLTLTSVFPAALVFGYMGWMGVIVDVGTVMTPAVALGVTVDDVVHFMLWFKRGIQQGLDRRGAVMLAYKGCVRAMYQSWGVIGLGLSIFAISPFTPTQRFGLMMLTLLTAALPGNLLLLPALLAGPLGKFFEVGIQRKMRGQAKAGHGVGSPHGVPAMHGAGSMHGVPSMHGAGSYAGAAGMGATGERVGGSSWQGTYGSVENVPRRPHSPMR